LTHGHFFFCFDRRLAIAVQTEDLRSVKTMLLTNEGRKLNS
jgi:hypothetical protein